MSIANARPKATGKLRLAAGALVLVLLHLAAVVQLVGTEPDPVSKVAFVLAWLLLNCFWLALLRRPLPASGLSAVMVVVLSLLSRFKYDAFTMTVSVIDVMVVDPDTVSYLFATWPDLLRHVSTAAAVVMPILILIWWLDPFRVPFRIAFAGLVASFVGLTALSFAAPLEREDEFFDDAYVSKFARSGSVALVDYARRGILESDAQVSERLASDDAFECKAAGPLPNIIMILDESGFDMSALPGIKLPPNYRAQFRSFDGKQRNFVVEGAGGPTWFTEYNVLSGLSVRSYGRFADGVTRFAAGRVERGFPQALRRCGYRTSSVYTGLGSFVGARTYHATAGIERFYDTKDIGTQVRQTDGYYYDFAMRMMAWDRGTQPLFLFVYTAANHTPWNFSFRADLLQDWRNLGNRADVEEYLRRQELSARDYPRLLEALKRAFPGEPFLVVRFGDHQPMFAKTLVEPALDQGTVVQHIQNSDPRYYTTYYTIDTINFTPADLSSALDTLDAPYLPIAVMDAAGVPLAPSFAEQKKIMQRCRGLFYLCDDGAEARRFNRQLIDAGLIKGF